MIEAPPIRKLKLSDIESANYNPRAITPEALRGLQESLESFGLLEMPVVNIAGGKNVLVSGHQRVKALLAKGFTHADCIVVSFDPTKEKIANLSMNNTAIQGTWDVTKAMPELQSILADLPKPDYAEFSKLSDALRAEAEKAGKLKPIDPETGALEEEKESLVTVSEPGNIYKLGRHRLYCGSFADGAPRLFKAKKADACITDPPYNVAYEGAEGTEIQNDDLSPAAWLDFITMASTAILKSTNGPCYVFMSSKEIPTLVEGWEKSGGVVMQWLVWAKDSFTLSRGDYHHQYEPCLYGAKAGVVIPPPHRARSNVLEFAKPKKSVLHSTMKPVQLIQTIMEDCTNPGDLVFEPFCGSGTTLIVSEVIGRTCYASELELKHCDTIRKRWAELVHGKGANWEKLTGVE